MPIPKNKKQKFPKKTAKSFINKSFNCSGKATLEAKLHENDEKEEKMRTFSGIAYTGGIMTPSWGVPVVIDLTGLSVSKKQRPILKDHDSAQVVGHSTGFNIGESTLEVSGAMSGSNSARAEVVANSDNGFEWQMSVGINAKQVRFIEEDEVVKVNGRVFKNEEFYLIEKSTLREVSFVALGADDDTVALVANDNTNNDFNEDIQMNFQEWLKAMGFEDSTALSETQLASLQAKFDAEGEVEPKKQPVTTPTKEKVEASVDAVAEMNASVIANAKRIQKIQSLCNGDQTLIAKAVENNWDETKTELEVLRATSLKKVPNVIIDNGIENADKVMQASLEKSCGIDISKTYDAKTLEASDKHYKNFGLQDIIEASARANGYSGNGHFKADPRGMMKSAFSTISLPLILSNIANKSLAKGFDSVESAWRSIADIASVRDFKQVNRYALTGDMTFEALTANGEIKHGKVGEIGYTNQVSTYAKMFAITREMLINDDLDALSKVPQKIGRGGALKINDVFWLKFLDNTGIFSVVNKNLLTGGASALSIASLSSLATKLKKQTDPDGKTFPVSPAILLVPVELGIQAGQLMSDSFILSDGATAQTPSVFTNKNPHVGKYSLVESAYLSDTTLAGNSATAFYLLANPSDISVIEMAFLNGVQSPNVESADVDFDTLGIQMRGYFDFGCNFQEYRGGARSDGV